MPVLADLVNDLIALIPEDGSRITNDEIRAALESEAGEPIGEAELKELKSQVVAMGFAEGVKGPGGGLKAAGVEAPARATSAASNGRPRRNGNATSAQGRQASEAAAPASPPPEPGDPSRGFMGWVAPPERDLGKAAMEKNLGEAADQFRANSGLKAQEYSGPILGLIFLRFADARFMPQWQALKAAGGSERRGSREEDANAYQSEGLLYLPTGARFQELLQLPEAADIGEKLNAAMGLIEEHNSKLAGVLPRSYNLFTPQLLAGLLKRISEIPTDLEFDAFGRIYEYFLGQFARSEGQKGGEFFTPSSLVVLITEIVEPFAGRLLDPACGSGGMYVQSARFVKAHRGHPAGDLAICDADGYLWYQGRADDVFKAAGYRIGPGEIENCLVKHPAVLNAAVVPKPDRERGALVKAYVVLAPEYIAKKPSGIRARARFDTELVADLQAHVRGKLAPYEYPKEIEFVDVLPMTTTGKVQRRVLRLQEESRARQSGILP